MKKIDELLKLNALAWECIFSFRRAERRIKPLEESAIINEGLTSTQFAVLETLFREGDLKVKDVLNATLVTSGNMTVVIRNLERDGYITRRNDSKDKRKTILSLTEKGENKVLKILPYQIENISKIFTVFNEEEKNTFINLLKKL